MSAMRRLIALTSAAALVVAAVGCGDVAIRPELPEAYKTGQTNAKDVNGQPLAPGEIPLDPQLTA